MILKSLISLTDAQLVQEYRNGNSPALEVLVKRYQTELTKYISKIAGKELARDALQDTWVAMMTAILNGSYKEEQHFGRWIRRIAHGRAVDAWRTEHRFPLQEKLPEKADDALNEEELLMNMEAEADLIKGFSHLGNREKRVVLYALRNMSFEEIAKKLNIKNSTFARVMHWRALRKLSHYIL